MSDSGGLNRPTNRVLEAIAHGLEEIHGHFALEGMGEIQDSGEDYDGTADEDDTSEGDEDALYEEPYYAAGYDREDVEIAIDAFLSHLIRKKLIRKDKSGRLPSFAGVFEKIFGEEHRIAKAAAQFEEYIAGYFGRIDYENMRAAFGEFQEIQSFISKELEEPEGVEN
jgi:hypothetical protein